MYAVCNVLHASVRYITNLYVHFKRILKMFKNYVDFICTERLGKLMHRNMLTAWKHKVFIYRFITF